VYAPRSSAHRRPDPSAARTRRRLGRAQASIIGVLIVLLGLGGSALLAAKWHSNLQTESRKAFTSTTADLNGALDSRLVADADLAHAMRAIATLEPGAGETRYREWYNQLLAGGATLARDVAAALIKPITSAQLGAYRRAAEADPAFRLMLGGKFQIVPPGHRAVYCLAQAVVGGDFAPGVYPVLLDYCAPVLPILGASPFPALMRTAANTGSMIVIPIGGLGNISLAGIAAAVYRRGAPIATVAERRAALTGYIAATFDAGSLLSSLLGGEHSLSSLSISLYHVNAGGAPLLIARAATKAKPGDTAYHARTALGGGWLVETSGTVAGTPAGAQGVVVFGFGALVTLLVVALYVVLLRSRERAWGLVAEKADELAYLALHDPMTGLPNRTLVLDRAAQLLARGRRFDSPVTALSMDIDGFKQINDVFGRELGDETLRQIADRLRSVLRDSDTVGRLGGDEFVMLVDPLDRVGAGRIATRILRALAEPIQLPEPARTPVSVTASIGIATGLPNAATDLLRDADLAMYQAKAIGKGSYVVFESAMQAAAQDRTELEMGLAEALGRKQFSLLYQPIVELDTQRVVAAEALLRWHHPTRGETSPDVFIPIAEASGLIIPIGQWVLSQACAQCAAWQQNGHAVGVSVNVSVRQLERPEFVHEVRAALADSCLDAAWLTLEITETALMNQPGMTEELLVELKTLGVHIAVDDFGTGYSSLGYLRQFPIDSLKLDRSFITGLARSGEANALAHTLIQLGKTLGLQTLAEGVEAYTQLCQLQLEGCDYAQGYLFARPLTPHALELYLKRDPTPSRVGVQPELAPLPHAVASR
jgi:diguanylate cyclase (GGDEF)-like protein